MIFTGKFYFKVPGIQKSVNDFENEKNGHISKIPRKRKSQVSLLGKDLFFTLVQTHYTLFGTHNLIGCLNKWYKAANDVKKLTR